MSVDGAALAYATLFSLPSVLPCSDSGRFRSAPFWDGCQDYLGTFVKPREISLDEAPVVRRAEPRANLRDEERCDEDMDELVVGQFEIPTP